MPFTAKGESRRQSIIEGAARHLRSEEPGGVTLDDIRAVTRTSKSQIFHYFPGGKAELFLEVARYEADRVLEDQQPHLDRLDSWEAWDRWRDAVIARYRAQGTTCPLAVLMGHVGDTPGAPEVTSVLLLRWQSRLERGIRAMQDAGQVRESLDARQAAGAMVAAIQGGVAALRVTGSTDLLVAALDTQLDHLRGTDG